MENIFKAYKIKTNLLTYGNLVYRKDLQEQNYQLPTCFYCQQKLKHERQEIEMFLSSASLNPLLYEEMGNQHQNNNRRVFLKYSVLRHLPLHLHLQCHSLLMSCFCTTFFPSFYLSLLILIFSLFLVDIFPSPLCECHSK